MLGAIVFDSHFARDYGMTEAVLFQHILYWCEFNKANNKNFHEDSYWTFNKASAFSIQFPFLTERQVRYTLAKLEKEKLIKSGNFNKVKYDQTKWYTVTRKGLEEMARCVEEENQQMTKNKILNDKFVDSNLQNCKPQSTNLSDLYQMNTHNNNTNNDALKSFTNVQDFKAEGDKNPQSGFPSVSVDFEKKTVSPCNQENTENQEDTSPSDMNSQEKPGDAPSFDNENFPSQASPQSQSEDISRLNSDTIPDGGGFPFADDEKPKKAKKSPPKRKSARKTPDDTELDAYFATVDAETVRRMHEITETLYKKAQIIDPLYVRNGNYLRNQTKKLTDLIASSGRSVDEVEETFNFGFTDSFWCNVLTNVDTFIRNYAKIFRKMKDKEKAPDKHKYAGGFENSHIARKEYTEDW